MGVPAPFLMLRFPGTGVPHLMTDNTSVSIFISFWDVKVSFWSSWNEAVLLRGITLFSFVQDWKHIIPKIPAINTVFIVLKFLVLFVVQV